MPVEAVYNEKRAVASGAKGGDDSRGPRDFNRGVPAAKTCTGVPDTPATALSCVPMCSESGSKPVPEFMYMIYRFTT